MCGTGPSDGPRSAFIAGIRTKYPLTCQAASQIRGVQALFEMNTSLLEKPQDAEGHFSSPHSQGTPTRFQLRSGVCTERDGRTVSQSVHEGRGILLSVYIRSRCPEAEEIKGRSARRHNELNKSNIVCCHVSNVVVCNYCYWWKKHVFSPGRAFLFPATQLTSC